MNPRPVAGHQPEELNPSLSTPPSQEAAKSKKVAGPQPPFLQPAQSPALLLSSSFLAVQVCSASFGLGPASGGRVGGPEGEREGRGAGRRRHRHHHHHHHRRGGREASEPRPQVGAGIRGWLGRGGAGVSLRIQALAEPRWQQSPAVSRDIAGVCHRCLPLHPAWGEQPVLQSRSAGASLLPLFLLLQQTLEYHTDQ